jgi:ADP-ribose diphosphatase
LDDKHFLLIREWCAGTERYELGFPKGKIDVGETPEAAALRECMEEVGYGAKQITALYHRPLTLSPAYMSNEIHILLAQDLYPSLAHGDEPEPLEVIPWRWDHLDALLLREDFTEARSIAALWLAQRHLGIDV